MFITEWKEFKQFYQAEVKTNSDRDAETILRLRVVKVSEFDGIGKPRTPGLMPQVVDREFIPAKLIRQGDICTMLDSAKSNAIKLLTELGQTHEGPGTQD